MDTTQPEKINWFPELDFNPNTGLTQILLQALIRTADGGACIVPVMYTTVYKLSSFLLSMLNGPKERMFLYFRTTSGTLLAASHGKYFSNSDIDYTKNNPVTNPPPVDQFQRYTPLNATDPTIQAAAYWLYGLFLGWDSIPNLNGEIFFVGERYWITTSSITSEVTLSVGRCCYIVLQVLLLNLSVCG